MNKIFQKEIGGIYRLKVPFENIYTSVFLIKTERGNILIDCATYDSDVDEWIVPALKEEGLTLAEIKTLFLTHSHGDHAGGKERIVALQPSIQIVASDQEKLIDGYTVYPLKGHTLDCIGVFDEDTGTLIAGDGLQGAGIEKYRCSLESKEEYVKTLEKIGRDKRIENILFAHEYEPWYQSGVFGRKEVEKALETCKIYVK